MTVFDKEKLRRYLKISEYDPRRVGYIAVIFIGVIAIVTMLICSKSSPFYPLNDAVDGNAYFTVGKSVLHGYVPYRDLYDHKGPFLFLIHTVAALVSETSFVGIFFLEVIACFIYLYFAFRCIRLYIDRYAIIAVPLVAAITYAFKPFVHGDLVEEYCLPALMYVFYLGLRLIRKNGSLKKWEWLMIGLTSGCVLWMKYSLLGIYIGWVIVIGWHMVRYNRARHLIKGILLITVGVIISTLPYFIYFCVNGALGNWFDVYFIDNLTGYSNVDGGIGRLLLNLYDGFMISLMNNLFVYFLFFLSIVWLIASGRKREFTYLLFCYILYHVMVYAGGHFYVYYSLGHVIFAIFGVICFLNMLNIWIDKISNTKVIMAGCTISSVLCVCMLVFFSPNIYMIFGDRDDMPQYKFNRIIENNGDDEVKLLTYGTMDIGQYTVSGVVPACKYFYIPNLNDTKFMDGQNDCIEKEIPDYIVVRGGAVISDKYEEIAEERGVFEEHMYRYTLYKRKNGVNKNE